MYEELRRVVLMEIEERNRPLIALLFLGVEANEGQAGLYSFYYPQVLEEPRRLMGDVSYRVKYLQDSTQPLPPRQYQTPTSSCDLLDKNKIWVDKVNPAILVLLEKPNRTGKSLRKEEAAVVRAHLLGVFSTLADLVLLIQGLLIYPGWRLPLSICISVFLPVLMHHPQMLVMSGTQREHVTKIIDGMTEDNLQALVLDYLRKDLPPLKPLFQVCLKRGSWFSVALIYDAWRNRVPKVGEVEEEDEGPLERWCRLDRRSAELMLNSPYSCFLTSFEEVSLISQGERGPRVLDDVISMRRRATESSSKFKAIPPRKRPAAEEESFGTRKKYWVDVKVLRRNQANRSQDASKLFKKPPPTSQPVRWINCNLSLGKRALGFVSEEAGGDLPS